MTSSQSDNTQKSSDTKTSDTVSMQTLVLALIFTVAGTVGVLEWQGLLVHPQDTEQMALASYQVVYVPKESEGKYRLSPKPSYQTSFCQEGYVFIRNDNDEQMQGLLVDYKNRGVKCPTVSTETTDNTETDNKKTAEPALPEQAATNQ